MAKHRIAVIPGDGVGPEVIRGGIKVLTTVQGRMSGLSFEFGYFPWGCDYYLKSGRLMPEDGLEQPRRF